MPVFGKHIPSSLRSSFANWSAKTRLILYPALLLALSFSPTCAFYFSKAAASAERTAKPALARRSQNITVRSFVSSAPAATFVVNSTGDGADSNTNDGVCNDGSGNCTLRAAIEQANASPGPDAINFNIGGGGFQTIAPATPYPTITGTVTIDGTTQPGFTGAPIIELNGANAGSANGLSITAAGCTVKGLVINGFSSDGILIRGSGAIGNKISGNCIGTDLTGTRAAPNGTGGVNLAQGASDNVIGGPNPGDYNVISGNRGVGVFLQGDNTNNNFVQVNFIGVGADGTTPLGNTAGAAGVVNPGFGVLVGFGASGNLIIDNVIAFNADSGVVVYDESGSGSSINNFIPRNSIHSNGGLGIDLGADGVTPNDDGDVDTGPNNRQNFATLSSALMVAGGVSIQGSLNTRPGTYTLQYYASPTCDPSGYGEGRTLFAANSVTTDSAGQASFAVQFNAAIPPTSLITVTTTDSSFNTSEFSPCLGISLPGGPSVQPENIIVLPDLITTTGAGFVRPLQMFINGVGFDCLTVEAGIRCPAKIEEGGARVTQGGVLTNGMTIDQAIPPGVPVNITFRNSNGGQTTVSYFRVSPRQSEYPPLVLTSVVRVGGQFQIQGRLKAAPNTEYTIFFRFTPTPEDSTSPAECPKPEAQKTFIGSIKVVTDGQGEKSFSVVFPDPDPARKGIVNAVAIPADNREVIESTCRAALPPSILIQEITVLTDQITARGFGFTAEVQVFVKDVETNKEAGFVEPAVAQGGRRVIQRGRLTNGQTIGEAIPAGRTVIIRFRNSDGNQKEVFFRN